MTTAIATEQIIELNGEINVIEHETVGRPFDQLKGDARKFSQAEAIAVAQRRAKDRGVRQRVTKTDRPAGDDHLIPRWLIQDF